MSMLSRIYMVLIVILSLLILIDCIRNRRDIKAYLKYGLLFGFILVVLNAGILCFGHFGQFPCEPRHYIVIGLMSLVVLSELTLVTSIGMDSCAILGCSDIPLTRKLLGQGDVVGRVITPNYIIWMINVAVGATAFSIILFEITAPRIAEPLKELWQMRAGETGASEAPSMLLALVFVRCAINEEVVFRLGIQNYLARQFKLSGNRYWIAIALTAGLWSLAHATMLDPEWVKIVQVLPLGIALGVLFRKFGVECCIFAHAIFNLAMMVFSPYLIRT